ncbi:MAG: sulfite exporter TauE/SafE family protein [Candidatus Bathyarchaeia archaeon]|nr:sulfite exporter TauE/SafE family protein [Candidatus Bathyarchaeota archaeon]
MEDEHRPSLLKVLTALVFGLLLGVAAGLIGVGGGEFRMPVLLYAIGLPVLMAITVNLLVGLLTVIVSFFRRFQLGLLNGHCLNVALVMSATSIVGAYIGALLTGRIPEKLLKRVLAVFLIAIGLKIGLEPFVNFPFGFAFALSVWEEALIAALIGLVIGVISGALGVAGGEFRIPALIYVFGLDIVAAGTTSLLVSIPTVASGFLKHQNMGHMNRKAALIAIAMGAGSVVGAFVGASYAGVVEKEILKVLLGIILVLATVRMVTKP